MAKDTLQQYIVAGSSDGYIGKWKIDGSNVQPGHNN